MKFSEYQKVAESTIVGYNKYRGGFLTAELSLTGEAGEILEIYNNKRKTGKPVDRAHLIEEIGDVLWGCVFICKELQLNFSEVLARHMQYRSWGSLSENKLNFKTFTDMVVASPGDDISQFKQYHENLYIHACQLVNVAGKFLQSSTAVKALHVQGATVDFKEQARNIARGYVGDVVENLALIAHSELGISLDNIAAANIKKLAIRYDPNNPVKLARKIKSNPQLYAIMSASLNLCQESAFAFFAANTAVASANKVITGNKMLINNQGTITGNKIAGSKWERNELLLTNIMHYDIEDIAEAMGKVFELNGYSKQDKLAALLKARKQNKAAEAVFDFDAGINELRLFMEFSCKVADVTKKAHYKGTDINQEKMTQNLMNCLLFADAAALHFKAHDAFEENFLKQSVSPVWQKPKKITINKAELKQ